jgi:hypothetical protein
MARSGINPYVGPRAFEEKDRDNFFGRAEETRQLTSLVIAQRAVVFHAPSGAGKTSLLQASLIPRLKRRKKVVVLPISRVGGDLPPEVDGAQVKNIYVFNTLLNMLGQDAQPGDLVDLTLRQGLQTYFATPAQADERRPRPRLFILDQFEELFTTHPDRYQERADFFLQLQNCLADYPQLSLLFVMREDYIAQLDSHAAQLPDRLRTRFRMERLRYEAALPAVKEPAARAGRPFAERVAEALVDNLRQIQLGRPREGTTAAQSALGTYVEPVHLQIVCHQLWAKLPPDRTTILAEDVQEFGDVDQALIGFYEDALRQVIKQTEISERRLRTWFDTQLITAARTRGLVFRGASQTEGLPNAAVDILYEAYIIRANIRGNDTWYELAHDRLLEPIWAANREWTDKHQNPLTLAAKGWLASGRDPQKLYKGDPLKEAQEQVEANPDEFTALEKEFISLSLEATRLQAAKRQRLMLLGAVALLVLFASLAAWALFSARQATEQRATAQTASARAVEQRATAEIASTRAVEQRATAEIASTRAVEQQKAAEAASTEAVVERDKAKAEATAAARARADLVAHLEDQLTAVAEALVTGLPETSGRPTPTPNQAATATVEALQAELRQARATQTTVAMIAVSPTPTPTPVPIPTPTPVPITFPPPGRIVFVSTRLGNKGTLFLINADGSGDVIPLIPNSEAFDPNYSPGIHSIVWSTAALNTPENAWLYTMNPDIGRVKNIGGQERGDWWQPALSPGGQTVAFVSNRDGNLEIYSMNIDGSDLRNLTNNPAEDRKPAWSPDSERIVFVSKREGGQSDIYVMNKDGTNVDRLTTDEAIDTSPAWSPDGKEIAFVSTRGEGGRSQIYVMDADGGNPRNLTNSGLDEDFPAWSPDSNWLAFTRYTGENNKTEVFVMTIAGDHVTNLTNHNDDDWAPIWIP